MLVMDHNKWGGNVDGSFDDRERHRPVFEVIPRGRDDPNNIVTSHHGVSRFGEHRF
jgi:hypothetical protein